MQRRGARNSLGGLIDAAVLPEEGRHADAIFAVAVEDGAVVAWEYDEALTDERKEAAQDRFDRLSQRSPSAEDSDESDE